MKVLVPVKSVSDHAASVRILADSSGIDTKGIKWVVNPFDEIAVEAAVRMREDGIAAEVVVVSIGPERAAVQLRHAMAMGADRAILIRHDASVDSDLASRALAAVFTRDRYDLVLMGKQAVDSDANQTAQLLAARLGLPQACFASQILVEGATATVTREVDGGSETIRIKLPAVVSADLRLSEPRAAALQGIIRAKKKPLEQVTLGDLGVSPDVKIKILRMSLQPRRAPGRRVHSVKELVQAIKEAAGLN